MPITSNRNFTTLNHLYAVPSSHRRDFVRENKENVRNKSKQQSKAKILVENYTPFSSSGEQVGSLNSLQKQQPNKNAVVNKKQLPTKAHNAEHVKKEPWTYGREATDRAADRAIQNASKTTLLTKKRRPFSSSQKESVTEEKLKTSKSTVAVQTDEINDEIFLYNALKKCASPAFKSALKAKYLQKENDSSKKQFSDTNQELKLTLDDSHEAHETHEALEQQLLDAYHHQQHQHLNDDAKAVAKHKSHNVDSIKKNLGSETQRTDETNYFTPREQCNYKKGHIKQDSNLNVMALPSGLFDRCSPSKCANCPVGYHLLSEKEREQIRSKYLEHEALLIKQLNSFPLAIETLRVRQSKTRIEKELSIIEQNLRKLTKRKVYAKVHE